MIISNETMQYFSKIEKHPLNSNYMLFVPMVALPPYFGTLKECKEAQKHLEKKLNEEFSKLAEEQQKDFFRRRKELYSY